MPTFGARVRMGMAGACLTTSTELAKEMTKRGYPVTRQIAARWMAQKEPGISARNALGLADLFNVRMRWLLKGGGYPMVPVCHLKRRLEVFETIARMGDDMADEWLAVGAEMVEAKQKARGR